MSKIIFLLTFICSFALAQDDLENIDAEIVKNKETNLRDNYAKPLTLNDAIETALRLNINEKERKYQFQINELDYKDASDSFYLPKLSLTMGTTQDHFVDNFYRDDKINAESSKTPTGFIGIGFDDYTLFNWGKDYLTFLNAKENYNRNKELLSEQRRELRLNTIREYFLLSRDYKIVQAYKKQLSHASFIYRLAKEKLGYRKISSQEFLQAKGEFLNAHTNYQSSLTKYYQTQESLAQLLSDEVKHNYKPINVLKFKKVTIRKSDAQKFIDKQTPAIKQAKAVLKNASRSYQKVLKDNMPLPKLSVKLGTYQRIFSENGSRDDYSTFDNSRNIELAATLNMSWTIYGSGGFLNSRVTERAYYQKRIAEINLKESYRGSTISGNMIHSRINYLEKEYKASSERLKNAKKLFDKTIDNYIANRTKFADMKDVLESLITATVELENVRFSHLSEKVSYASLMGLDDFPGEQFENLVLK